MIHKISLIGFHPLSFFLKLSRKEKNVAYIRSGEWTIVAWNPSGRITYKDDRSWDELRSTLLDRKKSYRGSLPFIGGAIGFFSYDLVYSLLNIKTKKKFSLPLFDFHFYDHAVLWNGKDVHVIGDRSFIALVRSIHARSLPMIDVPSLAFSPSITKSQYAKTFEKVKKAIKEGDVYQLNLTYQLRSRFYGNPRQLFAHLAATHEAPCTSYIEGNEYQLLSLSPERFIAIDKHHMTTCPIKGTRPRGTSTKEDDHLRQELLEDEKEKAELSMITDLLRNDLGQVSEIGSVNVTDHRVVNAMPSVWHTSARIESMLRHDLHPLDALRSCMPGGSITGCPKKRACEYIDALEKEPRGAYTGVIAAFSDHGHVDSSIIIRTLVHQNKSLSLGVGGGIVFDSECDSEYQETRDKAKNFLSIGTHQEYLFKNSVPVRIDDTVRSMIDATSPKAYGAFETFRSDHGRILAFDEHLRRLQSSARALGYSLPQSLNRIESDVRRIVSICGFDHTRIRIIATQKDVFIQIIRIHPKEQPKAIAATIVRYERPHPSIKCLPYDALTSLRSKAAKKGYGEVLLQNNRGEMTEGAYSNIFCVKNGILITSKKNILSGLMRGHVIKIARKKKIPVRYQSLTSDDLLSADEVFITNSIIGIVSVTKINHVVIGSKMKKMMTEKLKKMLMF